MEALMSEFILNLTKMKKMAEEGNVSPSGKLLIINIDLLSRALEAFRKDVGVEMEAMKTNLTKSEDRQDQLEAYSRRNCLLVMGVPEAERETEEICSQKILEVFAGKLGVKIQSGDIERCHRLGTKKDPTKHRPLIVKFWSYQNRRLIFSAKSRLKSTNLRICESLTKRRLSLLNQARDKYGVSKVWSSDGKILVKIPDASGVEKRHVVTTQAHLDAIMAAATPTPTAAPPQSHTSRDVTKNETIKTRSSSRNTQKKGK